MELHPVSQVYDGVFNTASGKLVNIENPTVDMIDIEDIAIGLSNYCRFGGQILLNYNVGQHSVLASFLAPPHLKKVALLHDAAEAYLGDVIKPVKVIIGDKYAELEEKWTRVIFKKFGLDHSQINYIKPIDNFLLQAESDYLRNQKFEVFQELMESFGGDDTIWSHDYSRWMFMASFYHLFNNGKAI